MKIPNILLAVVASLGLASCLEVKSVVTVNKDGTATIEETALLGAQLAAMMKQGGGAGGPGEQLKGMVLDKAQAEERAKLLGDGVTVKSHEEVTNPDGKTGAKVTYAVADIRKLKYKPFEPDSKGESKSEPITFALEGSSLSITNPDADKKKGDGTAKPKKSAEEIAQMKGQIAMMKPMFAGMRMTIEVKGAGGIGSTDASHQKDGTITYMDMQIDKLLDKPEVFGEIMESADSNLSMAEAAAKFKDIDGLKIEGKKVVKVELK